MKTTANKQKQTLTFVSIGGLGEIGLNCYLYSSVLEGVSSNHILVDCGLGFKDNNIKSVDTFFPDIDFLIENKIKISALLITHAHEDHIGAIPYLWEKLGCDIFATRFVADVIMSKLKDNPVSGKLKINIVDHLKEYKIGDFQVTWCPVVHSIPDSNLLLIKHSSCNLVHTGDFKVDESITSITYLKKLAKEGIKYLICDSTNVLEEDIKAKEEGIIKDLSNIINTAKGRVFITLFSSNLFRLNNILNIAKKTKRKVVFIGRSLENYSQIGAKHGYIDLKNIISQDDIKNHADKNLLIVVTGSQGEERSTFYNMLVTGNSRYSLSKEDTVIFSSKVIPGNETRISKLYNEISRVGANLFTSNDSNIHVSGHPSRKDLKIMYNLIKPEYIIPMHGETLHLRKHYDFAISQGYKSKMLTVGDVLELSTEKPEIKDAIPVGKICYDGNRLVSSQEQFLKDRGKMHYNGVVTIVLSFKNNYLENIDLDILGLVSQQELAIEKKQIIKKIYTVVDNILKFKDVKESTIKEETKRTINRYFKDFFDKRPIISIFLTY